MLFSSGTPFKKILAKYPVQRTRSYVKANCSKPNGDKTLMIKCTFWECNMLSSNLHVSLFSGGAPLKILIATCPVQRTRNYVKAIVSRPNGDKALKNKLSIVSIMISQNSYLSVRIDSEIISFSHNCPYRNHM